MSKDTPSATANGRRCDYPTCNLRCGDASGYCHRASAAKARAALAAPPVKEPPSWREHVEQTAQQWAKNMAALEEAHPDPWPVVGAVEDRAALAAEAREALLQAVRDAEVAAHMLSGAWEKRQARDSFAEAVALIDRLAALAAPSGTEPLTAVATVTDAWVGRNGAGMTVQPIGGRIAPVGSTLYVAPLGAGPAGETKP